jgi:hypothetical protein
MDDIIRDVMNDKWKYRKRGLFLLVQDKKNKVDLYNEDEK